MAVEAWHSSCNCADNTVHIAAGVLDIMCWSVWVCLNSNSGRVRQNGKSNIDYAKTLPRFWRCFNIGFCIYCSLDEFYHLSLCVSLTHGISFGMFNCALSFCKKMHTRTPESDFESTCFGIIPNKSRTKILFVRSVWIYSTQLHFNSFYSICTLTYTSNMCWFIREFFLLYQYWINETCVVHCSSAHHSGMASVVVLYCSALKERLGLILNVFTNLNWKCVFFFST